LRLLAALIGIRGVTLAPRQPWFDEIGQPPRHAIPADPLARLGDNPDLKRLDTTIAQRRADITLQRANAVPDVTARGGVRRFHESGETAFVASVAIPLPLSDRNQGGIQKANAELGRAEAEAERTRTGLVATLLAAEQRQTGAWTTAQTLRTRVVPAADQASRVAGLGYAEGKFSFLDLQDSRRSLSEARAALVEALKEFHRSRAEVDRLRGVMAGLPAQRATP
jgi:cobalt-zinc-cadmium efflux system outer membrane protein